MFVEKTETQPGDFSQGQLIQFFWNQKCPEDEEDGGVDHVGWEWIMQLVLLESQFQPDKLDILDMGDLEHCPQAILVS